jgi:Ca-activated chloride channel family protein
MKTAILILLLLFTDPLELARINGLKKDANEAFKSGNYELAASQYTMLADSLGVNEDEIFLNLAHSHFHTGDTAAAKRNYQSVASSHDKKLKSIASQQLGVLAKDAQKLEESLSLLKNAIKADPTNSGAKYDYELVKKLLDQQKENQQDQEGEDKDQKDQENKEEQKDKSKEKGDEEKQNEEKSEEEKSDESKDGEQKDQENQEEQEGEKSDEEKQKEMDDATKQKLKEMNISPEKAEMILEALKNNEIQYIQQQRRQPIEKQDTGKPDW